MAGGDIVVCTRAGLKSGQIKTTKIVFIICVASLLHRGIDGQGFTTASTPGLLIESLLNSQKPSLQKAKSNQVGFSFLIRPGT